MKQSPANKVKEYISFTRQLKLDRFEIIQYIVKWIPFSIVVGIATGIMASIFDYTIVEINKNIIANKKICVIFPLSVGIITGLIIHRFPGVSGPGINYIIWHLREKGRIPAICMLAKFVTSALALSGAFLAGREGPSFYIGAGVGEWLGKIFKITEKEKKYTALIGAGAFTGALFKAPLGGAIFALEIGYLYDIEYKPFSQTLIASVISYSIFSWFRGMHPFIEINTIPVWNIKHIPYFVLTGMVASAITYLFAIHYSLLNRISLSIKPIIRPIIGTVMAIPLLIFIISITNIHLLSLPVNYTPLTNLIEYIYPVWELLLIIVVTILFISLTLGFGISGGLILPNLLIGAAIGNIFGHIFPSEIATFVMAGMGSSLAASAKTPLAAIVLLTEMSGTNVVIPMAVAVITSYIFSFGISMYKAQQIMRS